jgi:hypothetical protein
MKHKEGQGKTPKNSCRILHQFSIKPAARDRQVGQRLTRYGGEVLFLLLSELGKRDQFPSLPDPICDKTTNGRKDCSPGGHSNRTTTVTG